MKTIINDITTEYEIKNSRFITILLKINDNFNLNNIMNEIKEKYPKATHYCYSYRTLYTQKSSDDGEPGGTAGIPMLNVLIKEDIINVLAVTVRYFGGIKLGAGGLVRAYTKSLTTALENVEYKYLEEGYLVKIEIDYKDQKQLDYLLKDNNIISKEFNEKIEYLVEIKDINQITQYNPKIIEKRLI